MLETKLRFSARAEHALSGSVTSLAIVGLLG